ncbi:MAG: hypothetical protein NC419_10020 [Muribaculaceae bacterium]|nr:hypothetical protein [Muribaculaceae bacterium]
MKRFSLICGGCILVLGIIIGSIVVEADSFPERSICLKDNQNADIDKDRLFSDYMTETVVSGIKDCDGVLDCKIEIDCAKGEIFSADVDIVAGNSRADALETDVLDYVSESFGIPVENITLSFHEEVLP